MNKTSLITQLYRLPSVRQFLERIVNDLAQGKSVLVILPDGVSQSDLFDFLRTEVGARDLSYREVELPEFESPADPVVMLGEILDVPWEGEHTPRTAANLLATESLPDVVLLEGLEDVTHIGVSMWLQMLVRWAEACEMQRNQGVPLASLCLVAPAARVLGCLPETRILLALHWWWGFPSALETSSLCRADGWTDSEIKLSCWRESLLTSIVGTDVNLILDLWDKSHVDHATLLDHLRLCADARGWEPVLLEQWELERVRIIIEEPSPVASLAPPLAVRTSWAHGALSWTPEFGLELSTAALAELGMVDEVLHRVWRGQVGLLLPRLDCYRLSLCQYLTKSYGHDWPTRWLSPESEIETQAVRQNPAACQFGHLLQVFEYGQLRRSDRYLRECVRRARNIRNEIAHFRPVVFNDFASLEAHVVQQ